MWIEHLGMTSLRCLDMRSSSWLTRKEGGSADTPPRGIVINSRHIGHLNVPVSLVCEAAIRVRQCRQTVCEQGSSLGVCSPPSYIPATTTTTTHHNNILVSDWGFLTVGFKLCNRAWSLVSTPHRLRPTITNLWRLQKYLKFCSSLLIDNINFCQK